MYIVDTFLVGEIVRQHTDRWQYAVFGQIIFVLVPRNAGLMLSGMETPLGMMMLLLAFLVLPRPEWQYDILLGVVVGFAYLCRPEFVLLAAVCLPIRSLIMLYRDKNRKKRFLTLTAMFAIALLVVLPWILHCYNTTGLPLPDSYYSKLRWGVNQEMIDLWNHFWFLAWFPTEPYLALSFVGGGALLGLKRRPYELMMISSLYALYRLTMPSMAFLFAARYLVPLFNIMAIAFVCGIAILIERLFEISSLKDSYTIDLRILLTIVITFLLFTPSAVSSIAYVDHHANQAQNIEEMQVHLSLWIVENVPENSTIATYDVGAIGYFARGTVLDLYGLVTPIILHNLTSLHAQAEFLHDVNCTYIMFYVEWFPAIQVALMSEGASVTEIYRVTLLNPVVVGTPNMAVFQIEW
jgi:hypothetical protein